MIEYGEQDYRDLCRTGRVAIEIGDIEDKRKDALRRFWMFLGGGVALALGLVWATASAAGTDALGFGIAGAIGIVILALVFALLPLGKVGRALKLPVLETLAQKGGLTYMAEGFDPPVYPEARAALFGNWLSSQRFTDLFHGADEHGRRFALYEGTLSRRQGKNTHIVFSGQMYAWQRRTRSGGEIVIVPDRGIFNFFKPVGGMERVKFENDPDFDGRFEVYAFEPQQAM